MRILNGTIGLPNILSIIAALVAVVLWAVAPLLVDAARSIPPFQLTTIALISGALAVLPMSLWGREARRSVKVSWQWKLVIFGLMPLLVLGAVGAICSGWAWRPPLRPH